jgi:HTH-type transcriptional regulator / antitoxin HigA
MSDIQNLDSFTPDWISPPGETIADALEERGWTQSVFAERTGFTDKHVSLLINGKATITEETALKLERVLGSSARFWLAREAQYREALARVAEERTFEKEASWLKELPLKHMVRYRWVGSLRSPGEQVAECLRFFGVASVAAWRASYQEPIAAFRASKKFRVDASATAAWLRQGELRAAHISCERFDKTKFKAALSELRAITNESDPSVFVPAVTEACSRVGVAVVLEPAPKGCPVSGATKWLSRDKALLMLSLRHRSNDHLWFSFFHEAGHLLLHGKRMLFIESDGMLGDEDENEANRFAGDLLIPPVHASRLPSMPKTESAVRQFASELGIAPGIVVGRMQKEGYLDWANLNGLKIRYAWSSD